MATDQPISIKIIRRWAIILGTLLLAFILRLYRLGQDSLWYDETVSAFLASLDIPSLVAHTARDIHPPGYYAMLHLWGVLAGDSQFALAYMSLLFGLLLLPLTYRLAHHLAGRTVALWALLLTAISPYHVWYAQEVRMYTLGAALGLVAAVCASRAFAPHWPNQAWRYWAGYVAAAAAGLYVLYYFAFLLIALNLFFLIRLLHSPVTLPVSKGKLLNALLIANGLILLLYLPWLPVAWRQATNPPVPPWRSPPSLDTIIVESWSALSLGQSVEPASVWPLLLLTGLLFGLGLFRLVGPSRQPAAALFLVSYSLGPIALIYLFSFVTPLYHVRYVFTYAPAFYIVLGVGIADLATRIRFSAALAALLILAAASFYSLYRYHFEAQYRADDFRAAVNFIEAQWQPGDAILVNAGYTYTAVAYYADGLSPERRRLVPYRLPALAQPDRPLLWQTGTVDGDPQLGWGDPHSDFYAMPAEATLAALTGLAADHPRLWLLRAYDTVTDPTGLIRNWLAKHAIPIEDQLFSGPSNIRVQGFLLPPLQPPAPRPIPFEDGLVLLDWHLPAQSWQPGDSIPLQLWWQASDRPTVDYKLSVKLWAPDGRLAAQGQDGWPGGALFRASRWPTGQVVYHPTRLPLPPNLPPGQYWLNVELYHPDTIQPLSLTNGELAATLGPIQITPNPAP